MITTLLYRLIKSNTRMYCKSAVKLVEPLHVPVMSSEVTDLLKLKDGGCVVDMTFGAGGHTKSILNSVPNVTVYALDRDPEAYALSVELAKTYENKNKIVPLLGKFSDLPELLKQENVQSESIDAFIFDLGCSSMQFDQACRGFSINKDGPLDMRMDGNRFPDMPTAADVLAQASEMDLIKILKMYGEEKKARKIARSIVETRYCFNRIKSTKDLADIVASACDHEYRLDKLQRSAHSATKTFQALRIFVNNELNEVNYGLILAEKYLKVGGRLAAISFHSLEDRIVKRHLQGNIIDNAINPLPLKYTNPSLWFEEGAVINIKETNWKLLHKHVICPNESEVFVNPRSRSAKLRVAEKIK